MIRLNIILLLSSTNTNCTNIDSDNNKLYLDILLLVINLQNTSEEIKNSENKLNNPLKIINFGNLPNDVSHFSKVNENGDPLYKTSKKNYVSSILL